MKKNKDKILSHNLSSLLKKFENSNVIVDMEKEYQSSSLTYVETNLINDNHYLKKAKISDDIVNKIVKSQIENGFKSPLVVRKVKDYYEIVLGRKRLAAAKKAKIESIPVVIIDVSDEEMLLILLADNRDQRESNVVETALLCRELTTNYSYSQSQLSEFIHQSRCQITNIMRLLTLPDSILNDISIGKLSYGHAKALVSLPESIIQETIQEIYTYGLSVREVENIVKRYKNQAKEVFDEEKRLNHKYHSLTTIKKKSITFNFDSEEEKRTFIINLLNM